MTAEAAAFESESPALPDSFRFRNSCWLLQYMKQAMQNNCIMGDSSLYNSIKY